MKGSFGGVLKSPIRYKGVELGSVSRWVCRDSRAEVRRESGGA